MAVNPLPPQAYTKETLQKAYTWLLTQSASIKDLATTQDMLISLYLKAQRNGEASLETPSIQNFKQELKSLANMMGDLQTTPDTNLNAATSSFHTTAQQAAPAAGQPLIQQQPFTTHHAQSAAPPPLFNSATTTYQLSQPTQLMAQLDQGSMLALAEVRQTLNLSSDIEALRALISLGYKQFKKM